MEQSLDYQLPLKRHTWQRETPASQTEGPRIAFALLIAFVIMLYSNVAVIYKAQLDSLRPTLLVAVAALFMTIVELGHARQGFRLTWPQVFLLIAFLGVCIVSTFSSVYVKLALDQTTDFTKIVLIYLLIENVVTTENRIRKVMLTMVFCGLFPAIGTIYHYQAGILVEGSRGAWRGIFGNPNEVAYALVVLIPMAFMLAVRARAMLRITLWAVMGIYLVAMFLTFSRGGFLTLFAVLGLMGWKQKSILIRAGLIAALIGGIIFVGMFWKRDSGDFNNVKEDMSFRERMFTFEAGGMMFLNNPLLGVGPGDSMVAYPLYAPIDAKCGCHDQLVVHNSFIQALAELGILGFVPFILFIGIPTLQALKLESGPLGHYATALGLSMFGFLVFSMSGGFLYTWWPYLLVGLISAMKRIADSKPAQAAAGGPNVA